MKPTITDWLRKETLPRNLYELLVHLAKDAKLNVDFTDEITRGSCLTYDGRSAKDLAPAGKDT